MRRHYLLIVGFAGSLIAGCHDRQRLSSGDAAGQSGSTHVDVAGAPTAHDAGAESVADGGMAQLATSMDAGPADAGPPGNPLAHRNGPVKCGAVAACPDPAADMNLKPIAFYPDFVAPWPCCADDANSRCGYATDAGCSASPLHEPHCPAVTIPLEAPYAGCCTAAGTCGIDISLLGRPEFACYDLALVPSLGLVPDPPAPSRCDGTLLDAGLDSDAGT